MSGIVMLVGGLELEERLLAFGGRKRGEAKLSLYMKPVAGRSQSPARSLDEATVEEGIPDPCREVYCPTGAWACGMKWQIGNGQSTLR